jgi:hypothetical protein
MNNILEFCMKAKLVGAEIVSTIVFLVFICVAAWREITRFVAK